MGLKLWILFILFIILVYYATNTSMLQEGYSGRSRGRGRGRGGSGNGRGRGLGRGNMRLNRGMYSHHGYSRPRNHHRRWWNSWYRPNYGYYYDDLYVRPEVYVYPTYEIIQSTPKPRSFYEDFVNFIRWIFGYPPMQ